MLPVPPRAVFSSAFGGTMGWRGSPSTIPSLLLQGAATQACSSKSSNPNASRGAAQSRILLKGHEHLKERIYFFFFFFRAGKELPVLCTALRLQRGLRSESPSPACRIVGLILVIKRLGSFQRAVMGSDVPAPTHAHSPSVDTGRAQPAEGKGIDARICSYARAKHTPKLLG